MPTRPLLSLPISITSGAGPHLQIGYDDPAPGTFSVSISTGSYRLDDSGGSTDLLVAIETALNAYLVANNRDGTFTVQTRSSGLAYRVEVLYDILPERDGNGLAPHTLTFLDSGELTAADLGLVKSTASPGSIAFDSPPSGGQPYSARGLYQRRWIWYPDDLLLRNEAFPLAEVVSSVSPFTGDATVDPYGEYFERLVTVEFVRGGRVYCFAADDPELFAGVTGALVGDLNLPLERFWRDNRAQVVAGTPPLIRFYPDATDPDTYTTVRWVDQAQLRDLRAVTGEEQTQAPLRYRCRLRFIEVF